ncbi:MAG: serine/threonine protein kinase [Betaproteobacteria bacterium]|nr:serine/threonine protein kinase [Betaproteobacteria bacterium]
MTDADRTPSPASPAQPYASLHPEVILDAVEGVGFSCDGRLFALNSFENRVYQVGVVDGDPLVAKFYRPGRWSEPALLEEHAFAQALARREIPVVAPIADAQGATLHAHGGFRFALYPRCPGRAPELDDPETLRWMGRFIGRIHAVGALEPFTHRPSLDLRTFGEEPSQFLLAHDFLPADLRATYESVVADVLERVRRCYARTGPVRVIRLHGDCHPGNILWSEGGPHFVDLDDARMGPAVQDLWMLLSGQRDEMSAQLDAIIEGYRLFYDFDPTELQLIEPLRTLRMIHYAGWLARRWADPAFPANFPWFNTQHYWQDHILALREQAALLDEPPLALGVLGR